MKATAKERLSLTSASFLLSQTFMALNHEGVIGMIVAGAIGLAAWNYSDEIFGKLHSGDEESTVSPRPIVVDAPKESLVSRLLIPRASRYSDFPTEEEVNIMYEQVKAQEQARDALYPSTGDGFVFSSLLKRWKPTRDQIFLARDEQGKSIYCPVDKLVHIALAGSTRQGKTSILRQLLAQLLFVKCDCLLLDPHYTSYDVETGEDWTPYERHMAKMPVRDFGEIAKTLHYAATVVLDARKERRYNSQHVGEHTFIFIDEYPAIINRVPDVQKDVAILLREGGKYNLHLVMASQDFQVKTVSPAAGGAIRENYSTAFYVGGDSTTANVLLDYKIPAAQEPLLGKGTVYVREPVTKQAMLARTPLMDNNAVYMLLGASTYTAGQDTEDLEIPVEIRRRPTTTTTTEDLSSEEEENSSSSLPSDWTAEEAFAAQALFKALKNKDKVLEALNKRGTIATRREELNLILSYQEKEALR